MRVGAAVGEGDELGEGVGALGPAEEGRVPALGLGKGGRGKAGAAEGSAEGHVALMFDCLMQG